MFTFYIKPNEQLNNNFLFNLFFSLIFTLSWIEKSYRNKKPSHEKNKLVRIFNMKKVSEKSITLTLFPCHNNLNKTFFFVFFSFLKISFHHFIHKAIHKRNSIYSTIFHEMEIEIFCFLSKLSLSLFFRFFMKIFHRNYCWFKATLNKLMVEPMKLLPQLSMANWWKPESFIFSGVKDVKKRKGKVNVNVKWKQNKLINKKLLKSLVTQYLVILIIIFMITWNKIYLYLLNIPWCVSTGGSSSSDVW